MARGPETGGGDNLETFGGQIICIGAQGGGHEMFELFYLKYACQYYGTTKQLVGGGQTLCMSTRVGCENFPCF